MYYVGVARESAEETMLCVSHSIVS